MVGAQDLANLFFTYFKEHGQELKVAMATRTLFLLRTGPRAKMRTVQDYAALLFLLLPLLTWMPDLDFVTETMAYVDSAYNMCGHASCGNIGAGMGCGRSLKAVDDAQVVEDAYQTS